MRLYDARLISEAKVNWNGVSAEIVERRLGLAPAKIHSTMTQHALYVELSEGITCEREVVGFDSRQYVSHHRLVSFRPRGAVVRGTAKGLGVHAYGVVFIDPECAELQPYLAQMPMEWTPFSGLRSEQLWDEIAPLLAECQAVGTSDRPLSRFYVIGHVIALLALLAEETVVARYPFNVDSRIRQAVMWIDENLTREFSLEELSRVVNVGPSQLIRLFRRTVGQTPMAYVSMKRIREAQRLLVSSGMSIGQIASHLGYADQSHFTNRFKNNTGVTPAIYRRRGEQR